jgi:hypothetical protein
MEKGLLPPEANKTAPINQCVPPHKRPQTRLPYSTWRSDVGVFAERAAADGSDAIDTQLRKRVGKASEKGGA